MRCNEHITAALLLAALAATGCGKTEDTLQTKTPSQDSAQATPVSMADGSSGLRAAGDNKLDGVAAKPAGPVSFAHGEAAYQVGNYAEATALFEQYTGKEPGNPWGHFMLGLSAWKAGDPTKAETAFEDALSIDPEHIKSLTNLGRVLIEQGRFDDAFDKLMRAGDIDPNYAEVYRLLGRTYAAQGQIDEAMAAYREAIIRDNKDAWSMNNLGLLLFERGRADASIPLLAKAVELRNGVPAFHNNLGMALEHAGRFAAAATEYMNALTADPGYEKALRNLERVEAVRVQSEEPFDLAATASRFIEQIEIPVEEATAGQ
jgi:tetratricopeptide (TPR) repeat protein